MKKVKQCLWVYLLVVGVSIAGCKEEVEPNNINSDQDIITYAARSNIFKAQAGRLATQVAGSSEVKSLGGEMFLYYNASNDELRLLSRENDLVVPASLSEKQQKLYNELDRLWGQDFDNRYLSEMQKIFQEDIKWYEEASNKAKNNGIKTWVNARLSDLRTQQADVQQLSKNLGFL